MVTRRRRPRQINLRLTEPLRRKLQTTAKARGISTTQLMRQLLETGLENKPTPSLPSLIDDLKRDLRDFVESNARKVPHSAQDLDLMGRRLTAVEAKLARIPADVEESLSSSDMRIPKVRERVWGAPDETKSKTKPSKQK
jgi:hypothetical protein